MGWSCGSCALTRSPTLLPRPPRIFLPGDAVGENAGEDAGEDADAAAVLEEEEEAAGPRSLPRTAALIPCMGHRSAPAAPLPALAAARSGRTDLTTASYGPPAAAPAPLGEGAGPSAV